MLTARIVVVAALVVAPSILLASFFHPFLLRTSMTAVAEKLFVRLTTFPSYPRPSSVQDRRPFSHIFICICPAPHGTKQNEKIVRMLWLPLTYAYFRARVSLLRYSPLYSRRTISIDWEMHERPSHLPFFSARKLYKSDRNPCWNLLINSSNIPITAIRSTHHRCISLYVRAFPYINFAAARSKIYLAFLR